MKKIEVKLENDYKVILSDNQIKEFLDGILLDSKELDAIWHVYKTNRDCGNYYSNTSKDYGLSLDSRASVIISIIEDYFNHKKK